MKLCKHPQKSRELAYKVFTDKENAKQAKKFAKIPFAERIIFAPHCMRNLAVCKAIEQDSGFLCVECGACKLKDIQQLSKELGYKGFYILKGGRAVEKIISEQKPKAVVGIACFFEGDQAFKMLQDSGVVVQFVPLTKDGCAYTDTDLDTVKKILELKG